MGDLMGWVLVERLASGKLDAGRIARLKPAGSSLISVVFLFFLVFGGALASVSTS
jgi:hypothetical protein